MELFTIFVLGSVGYGALEIVWRGYTHWTMLITGGICFLIIYTISIFLPYTSIIVKSFMCCVAITAVEFLVGYVVNIKLGWHIWDYSDNTMNIKGQICILYSAFWFLLSLGLVPFCNYLHMAYIK